MSIKLTSTKFNTYNEYKLYRATVPDAYSGTVIATNSTGVFTDTTAADGVLYYYGIEGNNGTAATTYREPIVGHYNLNDWGPFTAVATANINQNSTPYGQGSMKNGVFIEAGTTTGNMPNILDNIGQTKFNTWAAAAGVSPSTVLVINTSRGNRVGAGLCLDGKLMSLCPISSGGETYHYNSGSSVAATTVAPLIRKFADYVNALSDNSNVVDINGFRWKMKVMTRSEFNKNLINFCLPTYDGASLRDFTVYSEATALRSIMPGDALSSSDVILEWLNGLPTFSPVGSLSTTYWGFQCYFEYVGRV